MTLKEAHQLEAQAKRCSTKIRTFFSNFEKRRLGVAEDVISCVALDYVSIYVHAKFFDSR